MGFWNKLGKIALQAAPYIAAPFTGGASLAATGLTQQLGNKWAQSDANKAAQKGLGPSKFDSALGTVSGLAGTASGLGAFGKLGGGGKSGVKGDINSVSNRVSQLGNQGGAGGFLQGLKDGLGGGGNSGWSGILGGLLGGQNNGQAPNLGNRNGLPSGAMNMAGPNGPGYAGSGSPRPMNSGGIAPTVPGMDRFYQQAGRQLGPVMGNMNQNNPNLAESIGAGRMEAIQNQPFRRGYDVLTEGPEPTDDAEGNVGAPIVSRMPPIGPTGGNYMRDMGMGRGRGRQMSMAR